MNKKFPVIRPIGEGGVLIEYEPEVSLEVNLQARRLAFGLEQKSCPGLLEVIPAYRSVMAYFDPMQVELKTILTFVKNVMADIGEIELPQPRLFRIPTVYGEDYGPDLERVSILTGLPPDEVIRIFSNRYYPVYCLGFLCCLAYMGGVPEVLQVPRLPSPRPFMPAGSVGFAGPQANILPVDTPSGFNYIGRTFVAVYDPRLFPPTPIRPGDYIQCKAVPLETVESAGKKNLDEFVESL